MDVHVKGDPKSCGKPRPSMCVQPVPHVVLKEVMDRLRRSTVCFNKNFTSRTWKTKVQWSLTRTIHVEQSYMKEGANLPTNIG